MSSDSPQQRAMVDANGDIVLPGMLGGANRAPSAEKAVPLSSFTESLFSASQPLAHGAQSFDEEEEGRAIPSQHFAGWQERELKATETGALLTKLLNPDAAATYASMVEEIREEKRAPAIPMPRITLPSVPMPEWTDIREKLVSVTNDFVQEGARQYQTSLAEGMRTSVAVAQRSGGMLKRGWSFLAQPVWVPGKRSIPKKRSRGALFVSDVFRFGGTFAGFFAALFLSLNYQSFWDIVSARLDPLSQTQAQGLIKQELAADLSAKLGKVPSLSTAGQTEGDLLGFLPPVGPPENRLVIPKLDLNVPIVIPSSDALMAEDWVRLEKDIQKGLEDGVVHYPGTAKPGQAGNFFLTGHSSYFPWAEGDYKSVFARLSALSVGDEYWVFYGGDRHRYVIREKKEVKPSDVSVLDQPLSKRVSTLMTCTPLGTTLRRLIIVAQEVDPLTGGSLSVGEHEQKQQMPQHKLEMLPI